MRILKTGLKGTGFFLFLLQGCMVLQLQKQTLDPPVSLTGQIRGYRISPPQRHFQREIWVYHLLGLPGLPLGTREGLDPDTALDQLLQAEVTASQGIIHLRLVHQHTAWTLIAAAATLGVIVPQALLIEGDVVNVVPHTD
jgi:hypothetical protein